MERWNLISIQLSFVTRYDFEFCSKHQDGRYRFTFLFLDLIKNQMKIFLFALLTIVRVYVYAKVAISTSCFLWIKILQIMINPSGDLQIVVIRNEGVKIASIVLKNI